jgi:PBP1b-binding outer membrane lipoprotein LpoB
MTKIITLTIVALFLAGCTTHVSSGVSYEVSFGNSSSCLAVANTVNGPVCL